MNLYQIKYSKDFTPPAPVVELELENPVTKRKISLEALLDTGFSGTIIVPIFIYEKIGLYIIESLEPAYVVTSIGFYSKLKKAKAYIEIPKIYRKLVCVYSSHTIKYPILGRDILNDLDIRLNGPEQLTTIYSKHNE